ncbi:cytochrome protein, partial [Aureobasidium melanogenum]
MYGVLFGVSALFTGLFFVLAKWTFDYFKDPKGLRRYPNMHFLSGITNVPYMLLSEKGFRSKKLLELHASGMPVIRVGPNSLSYGDTRAIKDIYGHNTKCTKDENYVVTAGTHYHLADVVDKKEHQRKRKVLSSAYALKNLEEWEFKVADKTIRLINQIDKRCSDYGHDEIVDYKPWLNYFTLDAIADIGISHRLGFLDQGSDRTKSLRWDGSSFESNYRECLYANSQANSVIGYCYDYYKPLVKLSKWLPHYNRLWKLNEGWDGIVLNLTTERLKRYQAGEKLDDFFEAMMHDKNGVANNLEFGEIAAEVSIMMNAGSTTTAIAMTNVMYMLLKNPACMQKLRDEVDDVLDGDEVIAPYEKVKYLPYLRACLDESMRIFPPTSHGLTRATPPEGSVICGEFVPGNTTVSVSAFVAHRDPKIFPDAEKYTPERWLGEAGKELGPYFVAFSAGARGCIGRNISYLEQTVVLASMLHRYDFELADPAFEPERHEFMNLHLSALPVRIRRRARESLSEKPVVVA